MSKLEAKPSTFYKLETNFTFIIDAISSNSSRPTQDTITYLNDILIVRPNALMHKFLSIYDYCIHQTITMQNVTNLLESIYDTTLLVKYFNESYRNQLYEKYVIEKLINKDVKSHLKSHLHLFDDIKQYHQILNTYSTCILECKEIHDVWNYIIKYIKLYNDLIELHKTCINLFVERIDLITLNKILKKIVYKESLLRLNGKRCGSNAYLTIEINLHDIYKKIHNNNLIDL